MSRNEEFHNVLGLTYGPGKPGWDTTHEGRLKHALESWVGDPVDMSIHTQNVMSNSPAGSARMHGAASALLNELWDSPQRNNSRLYRGARKDEKPGIKSYSEDPRVARTWARKYGGSVKQIKASVGLQMSKYVDSSLNQSERQWIVDENDPRNQT